MESADVGGDEERKSNGKQKIDSVAQTNGVSSDAGTTMVRTVEELLEEGKACVDSDDFAGATEAYSRALELSVAKTGNDLAEENATLYYKYGNALIKKYRSEANVFGNALQKRGAQAAEDNEDGDDDDNADDEDDEDDERDDDGNESLGKARPWSESSTRAYQVSRSLCEILRVMAEEEEKDDLEIAWESLEAARCILSKTAGREFELADVLISLGDLSMEKDDFEQCVQDYNKALKVLEQVCEPDDRRLAEIYYLMAIPLQFSKKPSLALDKCKAAIDVCQKRREKLAAEMSELDGVLAELNEKKGELIQVCSEPSGMEAAPREDTIQHSGFDKPMLSDADRQNVKQVTVVKPSKSSLKPTAGEGENGLEDNANKKRRITLQPIQPSDGDKPSAQIPGSATNELKPDKPTPPVVSQKALSSENAVVEAGSSEQPNECKQQ